MISQPLLITKNMICHINKLRNNNCMIFFMYKDVYIFKNLYINKIN